MQRIHRSQETVPPEFSQGIANSNPIFAALHRWRQNVEGALYSARAREETQQWQGVLGELYHSVRKEQGNGPVGVQRHRIVSRPFQNKVAGEGLHDARQCKR